MFAIQHVNRPGQYFGGFIINDGTHTVFVPAVSPSDRAKLNTWLGKGDKDRGRDECNAYGLSMPDVVLNPKQYNDLVKGCSLYSDVEYGKGPYTN